MASLRLIVRRKPKEIEVERWDGPGHFVIPREHSLGDRWMEVHPGDYIAKNGDADWYPLAASVLQRDFEFVRGLELPWDQVDAAAPPCETVVR